MTACLRRSSFAPAVLCAVLVAGCGLNAGERRHLDEWLVCDGCSLGLLDSAVAVARGPFQRRAAVRYLLDAAIGPGDTTARRAYEIALGQRFGRDSVYAVQARGGAPLAGWPTRVQWISGITGNLIAGMQIRAARALGRIGTSAAFAALDSMAAQRLRPDVAEEVVHIRRGAP